MKISRSAIAARRGAPDRFPCSALHALGLVLSGPLAVLFVVCALLPLIHVAGDPPRGVSLQPVLTQSMPVPASDAGGRVTAPVADSDDAHEDAVRPRILALGRESSPRPTSPRVAVGFRTAPAALLDRPPRTTANG